MLQRNAWVTLGIKAPLQASVSCSANEKWGQSSSSPSPFDILWLIILIDTLSLLPTAQLALLGVTGGYLTWGGEPWPLY